MILKKNGSFDIILKYEFQTKVGGSGLDKQVAIEGARYFVDLDQRMRLGSKTTI